MPLTLLQIVQQHASRQGLKIPPAVASSQDAYCRQAVGLLNEFCEDLNTRKFWQANVLEASWAAAAVEDQGDLSTLAPYGFQGIILDTFWNRTQQLRVEGALSPDVWQARKAANFSGPLPAYRLRGNRMLLIPVPTAGHQYIFEYYSNWFVRSDVGDPKFMWTSDTDTCSVDDSLPIAYLRWAWRREKGFDFAEDKLAYENLLFTRSSRDEALPSVDMSQCSRRPVGPGVIVPAGSWNLP